MFLISNPLLLIKYIQGVREVIRIFVKAVKWNMDLCQLLQTASASLMSINKTPSTNCPERENITLDSSMWSVLEFLTKASS